MLDHSLSLADVGELTLIEEIVLPIARQFDVETVAGDDCAYLVAEGELAITADVGPKPLLHDVAGYEGDLEAAGWLAVVATASDVATSGAKPLFLTNCIDAPPSLTVGELSAFLTGYFRACSEFGFKNGGGDLRHGPKLTARVFGAGLCQSAYRPTRSGLRVGDLLAVIGPAGQFMANYLRAKHDPSARSEHGRLHPEIENALRWPRPQLSSMAHLVGSGLVQAASDTSDGLIGALDNLVRSSRVGIHLDLRRAELADVVVCGASAGRVDPWNVFVAWGDWSVAIAVASESRETFESECRANSIEYQWLGRGIAEPEITATIDGEARGLVTRIRNENFVGHGFNAGLAGHLEYILETQLFAHNPNSS